MNRILGKLTALAATLAVAVGVTSSAGRAEIRAGRRSGPHDWSHGHVIATRFGPDLDRNLEQDWRTLRKHALLEHARAMRAPAPGWFEAPQDQLAQKRVRSAESHLDWSLRTGGFGSVVGYPAKYSFDISASNCSDVIYFTVDQTGSASRVNVVATTNAYAGCSGNAAGTTPTVKFGLRMGTGTATSAVPSLDGKVLYVIESRPSGSGGVILHAINVNNITSGPGTYNFSTQAWSGAHTLAAPTGLASSEQLFQITFAGVSNNAASPFLDYSSNQMFFGDSSGRVHHVVNVNTTSAARDTTNFPVSCGTAALQSPVFVNGQVIVSSADGKLYRIDTTAPPPYTCVAAAQAGTGTGAGAAGGLSAPVVDVSNNQILITTNNAYGYGVSGMAAYNLTFASGENPPTTAYLGAASTAAPVSPSFDDAFWSSNNGNVYAVGTPVAGGNTYLIRTPYTGALGTPVGYAALHRSGAAAAVAASPVTEFLTASSLSNPDFVFVGGGGGTYLFMNRIASGFAGTDTTPVSMDSWFGVPAGAISGISIDTRTTAVTGSTATANIYFGTVGIASSTQSTIVQLAQQF